MKLKHASLLVTLTLIILASAITSFAQTQSRGDINSVVVADSNNQTNSAEPSSTNQRIAQNAIERRANLFADISAGNTAADQTVEVDNEKDSKDVRSASLRRTPTEPRLETGTAPRNPQAADTDRWQFQITPYFWLASLHGTGGVGNRSTEVDESFSDIFHSLNFALMGTFEARKNKLVILTDLEYVSIEDDRATPGPLFSNVTAGFKTFIFDPEVGYRVYEDSDTGASIDVLGGIRVWRVSTDLDFGAGILPAVRVQGSRTWVDAIGGIRGKAALSKKVFLTGKFDLGGGGSKFTWQLFGGLGYSITEKIALIGGYRVLDVNYDKNNFIYDMNQRGPIMGVGFRF